MPRWPFFRRRNPAPASPGAAARGRPAWMRLPRLVPTLGVAAPMTIDVGEPAPMSLPAREIPSLPVLAHGRPGGRVAGLVRPVVEEPLGLDLGPPAAPLPEPARRSVPARSPAPARPASLTVAAPEFVAEPEIPEVPYRPSAWLHEAAVERDRMMSAMAASAELGLPLPPPMPAPAAPPAPTTPPASQRVRRASLAESRRKGIGLGGAQPSTVDSPDAPEPEPGEADQAAAEPSPIAEPERAGPAEHLAAPREPAEADHPGPHPMAMPNSLRARVTMPEQPPSPATDPEPAAADPSVPGADPANSRVWTDRVAASDPAGADQPAAGPRDWAALVRPGESGGVDRSRAPARRPLRPAGTPKDVGDADQVGAPESPVTEPPERADRQVPGDSASPARRLRHRTGPGLPAHAVAEPAEQAERASKRSTEAARTGPGLPAHAVAEPAEHAQTAPKRSTEAEPVAVRPGAADEPEPPAVPSESEAPVAIEREPAASESVAGPGESTAPESVAVLGNEQPGQVRPAGRAVPAEPAGPDHVAALGEPAAEVPLGQAHRAAPTGSPVPVRPEGPVDSASPPGEPPERDRRRRRRVGLGLPEHAAADHVAVPGSPDTEPRERARRLRHRVGLGLPEQAVAADHVALPGSLDSEPSGEVRPGSDPSPVTGPPRHNLLADPRTAADQVAMPATEPLGPAEEPGIHPRRPAAPVLPAATVPAGRALRHRVGLVVPGTADRVAVPRGSASEAGEPIGTPRMPDPPPEAGSAWSPRNQAAGPGRSLAVDWLAARANPAGGAVAVPATVAGRLGHLHAVDVAGVPVRRGPAVSARAERLGARGFTEAGVVHVPDEAGDLEAGPAAALLAHELTHAAQQRVLGAALPPPGSPEGQWLEEEALAVEEWYAGGQVGAPPLRHLAPRHPHSPESFASHENPVRPESWPPQLAVTTPSVGGAEPIRPNLAEALQNLAAEHPRFGMVLEELETALATRPAGEEPERDGTPAPVTIVQSDEDGLIQRIGNDPPRRWLDLDDSAGLDELARTLYDRLVDRLRFDVLVQRERSGTLMDFR